MKRRIILLSVLLAFALPALSVQAFSPKHFHPVDSNAPARPDPELHLTNETSEWSRHHKQGVVLPTEVPSTGDRGNWITKNFTTGRDGVQVTGSARLFDIPVFTPIGRPDALLYGPTERPHGTACLEATAAHWRTMTPTPGVTNHMSAFWNHCSEAGTVGWVSGSIEWFDNPTWRSKYVTTDPTLGEVYTPRVNSISTDCTRGEIWNYSTGVWDIKTPTMCGTSAFTSSSFGWVIWESTGFMDSTTCNPAYVPLIRAATQKIYDAGTSSWVALATAYGSSEDSGGKCWSATGPYYPEWTSGTTWDWRMHTPDAARMQIEDVNFGLIAGTCLSGTACPAITLHNGRYYTVHLDNPDGQLASGLGETVGMVTAAEWGSRSGSGFYNNPPCTSNPFVTTNSGTTWKIIGTAIPAGTLCMSTIDLSGIPTTTATSATITGYFTKNGFTNTFSQNYTIVTP